MTKAKVFTSNQAKEIGETLGVDWSKFNIEQFRMGIMVELEHGKTDPVTDVTNNDPSLTGKIALAHLTEYPDYYTRLEKMEKEAEEYWEGNNASEKSKNNIGTERIFTAKNDDREDDESNVIMKPKNNIGTKKIFTSENDNNENDSSEIKGPDKDITAENIIASEMMRGKKF
ncbi:DUF5661 family protein [Clostridium lacusfryxellense]|uniref:DUF5661 family protein n=1 Tax=Clostridium lacusfryxellense TaxID=205328 RepID=UPI0028AB2F04|nr:DUF5661 family protein [Clostridium lacusfryxellense]